MNAPVAIIFYLHDTLRLLVFMKWNKTTQYFACASKVHNVKLGKKNSGNKTDKYFEIIQFHGVWERRGNKCNSLQLIHIALNGTFSNF